jgi:flagellar motor switch protein FliN/FliY
MTVPRLQLAGDSTLDPAPGRARRPSFARLGSIEVSASVELGRAELLLRELARLGRGSVVRLDASADEPVDLMVSGRLFARGEIVVIDDHLGLRITELASADG